jgi:hypothetical protein
MRFGVCQNIYVYHGWLPPIPTVDAWKALAALGVGYVRLGIPAGFYPSSDPNSWNWKVISSWIDPMHAAGLKIYFNPTGAPPWASEGQPAYIGSIAGWPPETAVPPAAWGGTSWWDDPAHPDGGHVHFFDQDPKTNPKFAAIDKQLPDRPYLKNPPPRDPEFAYNLAYQFLIRYPYIDSIGIENEPGGFDNPIMRYKDIAYGGKEDTIRTRFFPESVIPFTEGVKDVQNHTFNLPDSLQLTESQQHLRNELKLVGCEADSADVLERCCQLEDELYRGRPSLSCYDVLSVHPYGDLIGGDYRTMEAFTKVLDKRKSRRPVRIGEIGGDPQALYDWTVTTTNKYPDIESIYYGTPEIFFEKGMWPKTPIISDLGRKFSALFKR